MTDRRTEARTQRKGKLVMMLYVHKARGKGGRFYNDISFTNLIHKTEITPASGFYKVCKASVLHRHTLHIASDTRRPIVFERIFKTPLKRI